MGYQNKGQYELRSYGTIVKILDKNNTSKDVFADSRYRSKENLGFRERPQRRRCKNNWNSKSRGKNRAEKPFEHIGSLMSKYY